MSVDLLWTMGLSFVAVIVFLQVVSLMIGVNRLLKLQLWTPRKTPCLRHATGDMRTVLEAARAEMEQAGFRYMHSWRERAVTAAGDVPASYCDVYHHLAQDVHAEVYPSESPYEQRLYTVYLWNTYIDGRALLTLNGTLNTVVPYPGRVTVINDKSSDFAGQLATHLHVRELITVQRTDPVDAPEIAQNLAERWLVRLEREGKVYQRGQRGDEPVYGFRFWPALKMVWSLRKGGWRKSKTGMGSASSMSAADVQAVRQARDRYSFVRTLCALRSMSAPRWYQLSMLFVSAVFFMALGSYLWGLTGALVIAAVIALHEAGHWAAMKLSGFRDVQVFFVPGMGGVTSGEKHEARPLTHMLVYLAGPMPGIVLALAAAALVVWQPDLLTSTTGPYLSMAIMAALLVNGFNLLPVLPLDGGRVIDLLLIARLPWLRFAFSLASGMAMLAYGLYINDRVLPAIGILMLIAAQFQYKLARTASLLQKQNVAPQPDKKFAVAVAELFDFLEQPQFIKWSFTSKLAVGQALLPRYLGRLPGWKESATGLGIYLVSIMLPIAAIIALLMLSPGPTLSLAAQGGSNLLATTSGQAMPDIPVDQSKTGAASWEEEKNSMRQARAEKLNAAQGEARIATIKAAIEEASDSDPEDALRIARIYYAENNNSVQATYQHADAALSMAHALGNWAGEDEPENEKKNQADIANYLQEAEAILRTRLNNSGGDKNDARLLAEVLQARDYDPDNPSQLALKQEVVKLFAKDKQPGDTQLFGAHQMLARGYYRSGSIEEAEHELEAAYNDYECAGKLANNFFCQTANTDMAWILAGKKKFDEAGKLLAQAINATTDAPAKGTAKRNKPGIQNEELVRTSHQIRWMMALQQKDFVQARAEAVALQNVKAPGTGTWWIDFFLSRNQPISNYQADLMLIESLRALGEQTEASKLSERLQETQRKAKTAAAKAGRPVSDEQLCRTPLYGNDWKNPFQQTLLNIEQRETRCKARTRVSS